MKKRKLFRFIMFGLPLLFILCGIGLAYLNKVVIPVKIKSLIIQNIEGLTQKKVSLGSAQFNPFKGLILRKLIIYDSQKELISIKEASCTFLILPIFKEKKIFIPTIKIEEPKIFLERKADSTFNLLELIPKKQLVETKQKFSIIISGIHLSGGHIDFKDNNFSPAFTKSIAAVNLNLFLSLPNSVRFNSSFKILTTSPAAFNVSGEFQIFSQQLLSKITIDNLMLKEFSPYYSKLGVSVREGVINASITSTLKLKDSLFNADITARNKDIVLSMYTLLVKLNAEVTANLRYHLKDKLLTYSGTADLSKTAIEGIETIGEINNLNARIKFTMATLSADKATAAIWGFPVEANVRIEDFSNPSLSLDAVSQFKLPPAQKVLSEKFKITVPAEITDGTGKLSLHLKTKLYQQETPQINGSLDIHSAAIRIERIEFPLEEINGSLEFTLNELKWANIHFTCLDKIYTTTGLLTDFKTPEVTASLSSDELSLKSDFTIAGKLIKIAKSEGEYLSSKFSLAGDINTADSHAIQANIHSNLEINLKDLKAPLTKFKEQLKKINPEGSVKANVTLKGNINNPKFCTLSASFSSPSFSLYGLTARNVALEYTQSEGLADILLPGFSFYDGTIEAVAKVNFDSENMPFWIETKVINLNIEKLKNDTPAKTQDITGTLQSLTKLNGSVKNPSKLSGAGKVLIKDGKLWELNLFKGLGKVIFPKDFSAIIFQKGYCEFFVKDEYIFTENLRVENPLVEIEGKGKIGFDNSVEAALNVHISDEFIPSTGTFKDVTTALMGQAGRFGIIEISGTLQKPEFKYKTPRLEVLKDITDSIIDGLLGR